MTLLEFLDRMGERRSNRPARPPRDIRQLIGFTFIMGYYFMVYQFFKHEVPAGNKELINAAMLTLGPPIGLIVGAMFRSDAVQEQAAVNTGEAFKAIKASAEAPSSKADIVLEPGQTAQAAQSVEA
jgi:hypothetical protein